ncbi:hypothetical protein KR222_005851 [Zaprionus bogoriensis]|nr:hypothetical protein KR222_005851 [Zaprionus bogoriensis]
MIFVMLIALNLICSSQTILFEEQNRKAAPSANSEVPIKRTPAYKSMLSNGSVSANEYLDKLDNLERSVAAVLIKVAYGTTSTTKRSIPDNSYILGLTTVATPLLTTLRYQSAHQLQNTGNRHRNYELDLERDHALPTSAPNADILKSNNNPTYPNPNRHYSSLHERDRHRHIMQYNSTPLPSMPNLIKKVNGQPTVPMYPGDVPSYSPPSRSFFTPPLPPEYQNPFADKPTLRGTNNDGLIANTITFNNRRPIPPPSLMPGHERIPYRPPDLVGSVDGTNSSSLESKKPFTSTSTLPGVFDDRKKALNTPSQSGSDASIKDVTNKPVQDIKSNVDVHGKEATNKRQEVLPNIRRILASNGKKGDIPAVLLKQVTQHPIISYQQPPASPIVAVELGSKESAHADNTAVGVSPNINKSKQSPAGQLDAVNDRILVVTTPSTAAAIGEAAATTFTLAASSSARPTATTKKTGVDGNADNAASAAAASAHTTWTWAWNIHIYLSAVLFTILSVYSFYKLLMYNKLTHLFAQSYFVYIHLILVSICIMRIFYLCYDAYNIHGTFHLFPAEILFNLPSTFLTVAFSVLILFLFLKSLNHKNNRYSALVRPLTVVVGCGVHVGLCITLHYVESYTLQNHQLFLQQQQQQHYFRRQQALQPGVSPTGNTLATPPLPPRVLSLICQIIYIFVCLTLGLLYLYLYRILKRILRSKSQNYIHGYQNLSYAIHITIATALLFVLLAVLQIFGATCISSVRPANVTVEVDWMQWGFQFSLRLIEIAIITLISWVTGLKASATGIFGGEVGVGAVEAVVGGLSPVTGVAPNNSVREKHPQSSGAHVANFFLPCTTSSSQEQFETDYPAICNANTNLHTYTMRTGKLIYDDSYAFNSIGGSASPGLGRGVSTEFQLQEHTYQRPYDTGSIRSAVNHRHHLVSGDRYLHHVGASHKQQQMTAGFMSADYTTDATTDHYENPNFDLCTSTVGIEGAGLGTSVESTALQKLNKHAQSSGSGSGSASGSGSGSSGTSQQQMLLLPSDSCYSEPLQENSSYEFSNFERPIFKKSDECWPNKERHKLHAPRKQVGGVGTLERSAYENAERRSSNSTNSCSSSNGVRCIGYNSYGVRKSGTVQNIGGPGPAAGVFPHAMIVDSKRINASQTLAARSHCYYQRERCIQPPGFKDIESSLKQQQQKQHQQHQYDQYNSEQRDHCEDGEEEEDDLMAGSQVECTNLISNNQGILQDPLGHPIHHQQHQHVQTSAVNSSNMHKASLNSFEPPATKKSSASADNMIVADQGFLRVRDKNEYNNKSPELVVTHELHGVRIGSDGLSQIENNVNGIDC